MSIFKIKLVRPTMHVVLEMTEGLPLTKGAWKRLPGISNSRLADESGEWENWVLGSPGGGHNIRLYDKSGTKSCLLKQFVTGIGNGQAEVIFPGFGGEFGDDQFQWFNA